MADPTGHILIVDDNLINRKLLSRALAELGHTSDTAPNGREALDKLAVETFDVVLLDILMDEMDGYETLERIKQDEQLRHLPVIVISALEEMDNVIKGITLGAEDYLIKPFNPVVLRARLTNSLEKKRLRDAEQLLLQSLERELEIGRQIQADFLPDALPGLPGWELDVHFHAAREVSGDFYDVYLLDGNEQAVLVLGDVCDKGVGAALYMTLFRTLLRIAFNATSFTLDTGQGQETSAEASILKNALTMTNDYVATIHGQSNMFATLFVGILNLKSGELYFSNAGHERPLVLSASGNKKSLPATGPVVGLFPDMEYNVAQMTLNAGDRLLVFSDGVSEATNEADEAFGEGPLEALLTVANADSVHALLEAINAELLLHIGDLPQPDDITMLGLRRE